MRYGVIVARLQIDSLHDGHSRLLTKAINNSDHVLVFLGVSTFSGTKANPLDYSTRALMVKQWFERCNRPRYTVMPICDREDDQVWSDELDEAIAAHTKYGDQVVMFGGKDSFLNHYKGRFTQHERFEFVCSGRATQRREHIIEAAPEKESEFRKGVIYAIGNTRATVSATVDIACVRNAKEVLVGRKQGETKWRFPGGFVDPTDKTLAAAARREFMEETGLCFEGPLECVCSAKINDWRFRDSPDRGIMTTLFLGQYSHGKEKAADDLVELKWIPISGAIEEMNTSHKPLYQTLSELLTKAPKYRREEDFMKRSQPSLGWPPTMYKDLNADVF